MSNGYMVMEDLGGIQLQVAYTDSYSTMDEAAKVAERVKAKHPKMNVVIQHIDFNTGKVI